jgi:hypothetical protein
VGVTVGDAVPFVSRRVSVAAGVAVGVAVGASVSVPVAAGVAVSVPSPGVARGDVSSASAYQRGGSTVVSPTSRYCIVSERQTSRVSFRKLR